MYKGEYPPKLSEQEEKLQIHRDIESEFNQTGRHFISMSAKIWREH